MLGADVRVFRNDAIDIAAAQALAPTHLCISPGPGTPYDAGVSMDMIRAFAGRIPVFGVCLGHQSIVEVFGGKVVRAGRLMHGKTSPVNHDGADAVRGPAAALRSGALSLADRAAGIACRPMLEVTARTPEGEIMGVRHQQLDRRRRAVPSRKRADAGWADAHGRISCASPRRAPR